MNTPDAKQMNDALETAWGSLVDDAIRAEQDAARSEGASLRRAADHVEHVRAVVLPEVVRLRAEVEALRALARGEDRKPRP